MAYLFGLALAVGVTTAVLLSKLEYFEEDKQTPWILGLLIAVVLAAGVGAA